MLPREILGVLELGGMDNLTAFLLELLGALEHRRVRLIMQPRSRHDHVEILLPDLLLHGVLLGMLPSTIGPVLPMDAEGPPSLGALRHCEDLAIEPELVLDLEIRAVGLQVLQPLWPRKVALAFLHWEVREPRECGGRGELALLPAVMSERPADHGHHL